MPLFIILAVCAAIFATVTSAKRARRKAIRQEALLKPFPAEWNNILTSNLPPYSKLTPEMRTELQQDIKVFLAEKTFEGCGGLEITDEIRLTIAAQACLLLLNREDTNYPRLRSILVYPSTYHTAQSILPSSSPSQRRHSTKSPYSLRKTIPSFTSN